MGVYTAFKDGYAIETIYGTSTITTAGSSAYLWGILADKAIHPSPSASLEYRATAVNAVEVPDTYVWKTILDLTGMYAVGMQNGILCWAVMGKHSVGAGPPYTHTITTPDDGTLLPSFTIHHERTGTATDWATQFVGCKVGGLTLTCGFEQKYLIARVDWIAQKAVDPNLDGTNAMLTNDPALPATATEAPYHFVGMSRTFDGNDVDGLVHMELSISPDFVPERAHTWDSGTYTGHWIKSLMESPRRTYELKMRYHPDGDDIWDELVATGNTKNIVFKWTKSTNDYLQATLTDCQVVYHEIGTPKVGEALVDEVTIVPRSITFEVKDAIAGGHYGD